MVIYGKSIKVYNAARIGVSTRDCTMYLTCGIPCADCARGIINAGIRRIVCEDHDDPIGSKWTAHTERSNIMFREAGVIVDYY